MSRTIGIVRNPIKVDEDELREAASEVFGDAEVRWWETTEDDPGRAMAEEAVAAGCDTVVAVGGDGTVRAVAEALSEADAGLGIVPRGTGNLLARNLGIPLNDVPVALERVRDGEERRIDLGWVSADGGDEHAFTVMVGLGLDAQMLVQTDDDLKARLGWLAYVQALGKAAAATELVDATVSLDGGEAEECRVHTMLVGNCGTIQGGITLLPDARPDDGRLDLLMISAEGLVGWLDTAKSVLWDNGLKRLVGANDGAVSTDSATHASVERVEVTLSAPQQFEIDGEEIGEVSRFAVRVQPGAVRVRS